jgi:protein-tyrosine phosphatase
MRSKIQRHSLTINHSTFVRLREKDFFGESFSDLISRIIDELEKPVIVHCNGGTGRTGTILSAYLMKSQNLSAEQAMEDVKRIRGRRPRRKKQLRILAEYERLLASQG